MEDLEEAFERLDEEEEVRKAAFLADYRAICEKHNLMLGFTDSEDEKPEWDSEPSTNYCLLDYTLDRGALDQAILEMRMVDLLYLEPPEDENGRQKG